MCFPVLFSVTWFDSVALVNALIKNVHVYQGLYSLIAPKLELLKTAPVNPVLNFSVIMDTLLDLVHVFILSWNDTVEDENISTTLSAKAARSIRDQEKLARA